MIAKDTFDGTQRVLNFRTNTRFQFFQLCSSTQRIQPRALRRVHRNVPLNTAALMFLTLFHTSVSLVRPGRFYLAMQEFIRLLNVVFICRFRTHAVNQTVDIINTNLHFHPKMSSVAFISFGAFLDIFGLHDSWSMSALH